MKQADTSLSLIPDERIANKVYVIRGVKVMLDRDLAELYDVETRTFNQAVNRNRDRFPEDFMFRLSKEELEHWRSQIVMSNSTAKMGLRRRPYAFTEQGVAMLSSVLKSKRAVQVNIQIIRTFTKLREILASNQAMRLKIEEMDNQIQSVYTLLKRLVNEGTEPKREIGFRAE